MTTFFILTILIGLAATDPQILPLSEYRPGVTTIDGVEVGAKLYIASTDYRKYLRKFSVKTGGVWTNLNTLSSYHDDGSPRYLTITEGLEIQNLNNATISETLRGYLYTTTADQAQDPSFAVYVITDNHPINRAGKTTGVVLNTHLDDSDGEDEVPQETSHVSNIEHSGELYFKWGLPGTKEVNTTFFSNPLMFNSTKVFFKHIEPLQVDLQYWYFVSMGPISMTIEYKFVNASDYTTTSGDTTGLTLNSFIYENHLINFILDETRPRTTGFLVSTHLYANVSFELADDQQSVRKEYGINKNVNQELSVYQFPAKRLTVTADYVPGRFYCQYFGFSSDLLTTSSVPSTTSRLTTTTVATTTKSSRSISDLLLVLLVSFLLLI